MPRGCPPDWVYMPEPMVAEAQTSLASAHPGVAQTTTVLAQKYWWLGTGKLVKTAVQSCTVCRTTKSPHCLPISKLKPLLFPNRQWSYIAVALVMDLSESNDYTTSRGRPIFQGMQLYPISCCSPSHIGSQSPAPVCLSLLWAPGGHIVRLQAQVHRPQFAKVW